MNDPFKAMKKKVFVVVEAGIDYHSIVGIYTTKRKALKIMRLPSWSDQRMIEVWMLDDDSGDAISVGFE